MLKAIAIYRDNSKLSQPLNASFSDGLDEIVTLGDENTLDETLGPKDVFDMQITQLSRRKLPMKRRGITREATVGGQKIFLRTGEYDDGTLGEIFLDMYRDGAAFRAMLNSFAILVSKALQYGIPLEELVETFTFSKFEPQGIVQGHEAVKFASSVLDYVFRSLGYDYLGRTDFVQVHQHKKDNTPKQKNTTPISQQDTTNNNKVSADDKVSLIDKLLEEVGENISEAEPDLDMLSIPFVPYSVSIDAILSGTNGIKAKTLGYTGEQCSNCSSMRVRRNGTCLLCEDCGTTSGCS
jgi:ribonucleoside-diphosphate reductase alpha chain